MLKITIWDEHAVRLQESHANLSQALNQIQLKAQIMCQSEPPLLSRMGYTGTTPVIEIENHCWRYKIGETITTEQFIDLLTKRIQEYGLCACKKD